jgi:uncharacterized protein (DUF58 family)
VIKPTRRAVFIFAAGVPTALLLAIMAPALWSLPVLYAALVAAAMVADWRSALRPGALATRLVLPDRLYIGDPASIGGVLNAGDHPRAVRFEILPEHTGALDPPEMTRVVVEPGRDAAFAIPLIPRRRGKIRVELLWLRWLGPWRLVEISSRLAVGRSIEIMPNVRGVQSAALQFFSSEAIHGVKVQRERGQGTEFEALREYAPGLDSRFIDWKHSARHRKLLCREFDTERNHQIVMAFDTGYLMREPVDGLARLDHAINAGLLLTWISLRGGDLVGIFGFDAVVRSFLQPVRGMPGFGRIQQAVAALDYRTEETNFTLGLAELGARLKRRALVVLFTDFVDTTTAELLLESVQRVASKHVVIFVTLRDTALQRIIDAPPNRYEDVAKAVVAHDLRRDRAIVLERLERMGIHCLDVAPAGLSAGLINRYLLIKRRGLI